jgi:uncharacterized DUF497 family protein
MILWDPSKARTNLRKHGVRFSDAEMVLFDPNAITDEDDTSEAEKRYVSIGLDSMLRVLVVVFTYRGEDIRLISARPATPRERRQYEEGIRL